MQKFYKVFLVVFLAIIGFNVYALISVNTHTLNWSKSDLLSGDNAKFLLSIGFGVIGIILLYVLHTWSKVGVKK